MCHTIRIQNAVKTYNYNICFKGKHIENKNTIISIMGTKLWFKKLVRKISASFKNKSWYNEPIKREIILCQGAKNLLLFQNLMRKLKM